MKKLKEEFQKYFGLPIHKVIPLKENLIAIGRKPEDAFLFGSRIAAEKPFFAQGNIKQFIKSCPEDYFLVGFWGHGVNSYAFYYSRVDSWSKVFFRLPYGGIYMDNDEMAKLVRQFLCNYFKFEQQVIGTVEKLIAIESMGEGYYRFSLSRDKMVQSQMSLFDPPDCKTVELKKSLFNNPNFEDRFARLISP